MKQFLVIASFVLFPALAFGASLRLICFHSEIVGTLIESSVIDQLVADLHPSGEAYIFFRFINKEERFFKLQLVEEQKPFYRMYSSENSDIFFTTLKDSGNDFYHTGTFSAKGKNTTYFRCADIKRLKADKAAKERGNK